MYSLKHRIAKFVLLFCIIIMPTIGNFLAQGTTETAWDAKFSPNGQYIAVATSTGSIIIYDGTRNIIQTLSGHSDATIAIAWSPDGNMLASGGLDEFVRLWDTRTWSMTNEVEVSSNEIYNLSWKPDGNILVGSSFDTLFIWDTSTWSLLMNPMNVSLADLVWSPDGSGFAFATTPTFIGIATLTGSDIEIQTFAGHLSTPYGVAWSSDGEKMASAGGLDGTIRLWDVNNNLEIASIFNNGEIITDVVFLNSQFIVASTEQGSLYTINTLDYSITDNQTLGYSINAIDWNASTEELIVAGDYKDNAGDNNSTITIVDVSLSSTTMLTPENTPTIYRQRVISP